MIYENARPDMSRMLSEMIKQGMLVNPREAERLHQLDEEDSHFSPVMRFTLWNPERRRFLAERMVYRGEGYWRAVGQEGSIFELATRLVPTLGTEEFYELW